MTELFKDVYNEKFYQKLSSFLSQTLEPFNANDFMQQIFTDEFSKLELKQRMSHTAQVMHNFLSSDYSSAVSTIIALIKTMREAGEKEKSIEYMFIPEYISMYGMEDVETSIVAMENITQFTSCEFAVRPFIIRYEDRMIDQLISWSTHGNNSVRRLASEGSRPRLPWAMALPAFKKDPSPLLKILENLQNDPCEIVRRSVANNINDISKDNPQVAIEIAKSWLSINKQTDALVKHACRTLLKQSEPQVLELFGFDSRHFELSGFTVVTPEVQMGDSLEFTFSIKLTSAQPQLLRLEYAIYYMKSNGKLSRKVFKISERTIDNQLPYEFSRKQSFKAITTRKYYQGLHEVSVLVNGLESHCLPFQLVGKSPN